MTEADRKRAAKAFAEYWKNRGRETGVRTESWTVRQTDQGCACTTQDFIGPYSIFSVSGNHNAKIDSKIPGTRGRGDLRTATAACGGLAVKAGVFQQFSSHLAASI